MVTLWRHEDCLRVEPAALRSHFERPKLVVAATAWTMLVLPIVLGFLYLLALKALPEGYRLQGFYKWLVGAIVLVTAGFGFYAGMAGALGG